MMKADPASGSQIINGFILSRHWEDVATVGALPNSSPTSSPKNNRGRFLQCHYWLATDSGPVHIVFPQQHGIFFVPESQVAAVENLLSQLESLSADSWYSKPLALKSFQQEPVAGFYFSSQRSLYLARDYLKGKNIFPLEADIQPSDRFLMERFITGPVTVSGASVQRGTFREFINPKVSAAQYRPRLVVMSLDIETSMKGEQLYSIAALVKISDHQTEPGSETVSSAGEQAKVFMCGDTVALDGVDFFATERQLLQSFLQWFHSVDPDIIIGWNVINFDLRFLQQKADALGLRLTLGRASENVQWRSARNQDNYFTLVLPGRAVLDGIDTLKSATYSFESFSLQSVANALLNRGKLIHDVDDRGAEITRLFHHDKPALAKYNLEDCYLVWDIFSHTKLLSFAVERARMTGLAMDRFGGSVAAFDHRYLPRLHRLGLVAPAQQDDPEGVGSPGGYVMESQPGIYRNVLVLDFKSLYPSIIRTFCIDPAALALSDSVYVRNEAETTGFDPAREVPGFNGAVFNREASILPGLIDELWQQRDQAKRDNNQAMSQAIKILMNSFYGVLGTPGCRFFDPRLPSSITLRGHQILNTTRDLIEQKGFQVIYGDTDSLFVWLKSASDNATRAELFRIGEKLAQELNLWWTDTLNTQYHLSSALELEFETCFADFVMPTIRGAETGSKKRYAGRKLDLHDPAKDQLVFKGLEAVRTDWTPLARQFQRELYRRIFLKEPYAEFIRETVRQVLSGERDNELVYRKRIRRRLHDYTRNIPPHIQAACRAEEQRAQLGLSPRYRQGAWIEYVLTKNGPEPREYNSTPLDYETYVERQVQPIVESIVRFLGTSFDDIAGQQLGLF